MNEALGWIKMYRSILEWDWWSDHNVTRLFLYFLVKANSVDKKWRGTVVKRGSFVTGLTQISEETGLSIQQLRTAIEKLKSTGEITDQSTSQYRIVTICNYDRYQVKQDEYQQANQQPEQQTDNSQSTDEQQANNNNQEYKNKRIKEDVITPPTPPRGEQKDLFANESNDIPKNDDYAAVIVKFWNDHADKIYPRVKKVTDRTKKAIKTRIKAGYTLDDIKKAILLMNSLRNFYKGMDGSGWKADFHWLIENVNGNFDKILEGSLHTLPLQQQAYMQVMGSQSAPISQPQTHPVLGIGEFLRPDGTRTYGNGIITIPNDAPPRRYSNEAWVNGKWTVI